MITFVTVWVLTVTNTNFVNSSAPTTFQLTYATQNICLKQEKQFSGYASVNCNFQQVPIYIPTK